MKRGIYACFFKRFFDFIISLLAIVILSPFIIITYLLSLVILRGNPIFKQYRPGKNGKIFPLYKFRSMTNKTDENGELLPDAQRITKWGKFLRKTSLDELPQLFNIFVGDMSIVGPRPRLVKDMIFYDDDVMKAYSVRPGLTGPAQVYDRRSESSWESVFERDLEYAKHVTFLTDLKLFFGTFTALFKGGSASGSANDTKLEKREYYYGDYLLKTNQITKEQYDEGHKLASEIEHAGKGVVKNVVKKVDSEVKENVEDFENESNQNVTDEMVPVETVSDENIVVDSENQNDENIQLKNEEKKLTKPEERALKKSQKKQEKEAKKAEKIQKGKEKVQKKAEKKNKAK